MSDYVSTPNLGLKKPIYQQTSGENWTSYVNENADTLDAAVTAVSSGAAFQPTPPTSPQAGMLWARPDGALFVYSGSVWIQVVGAP